MKNFTPAALATLVTAGMIAVATPAAAQSERASIRVSYADLNLSTDLGKKTLDRRVDAAAKAVCDFDPYERDLSRVLISAHCTRAAVSQARVAMAAAKANTPALAAR